MTGAVREHIRLEVDRLARMRVDEAKPPPARGHCADCGAKFPAATDDCWLCQERVRRRKWKSRKERS